MFLGVLCFLVHAGYSLFHAELTLNIMTVWWVLVVKAEGTLRTWEGTGRLL